MKKLILFLIIFSAVHLSAQERYFVYFKDKGITEQAFKNNRNVLLKNTDLNLSQKAVERRKKKLGDDFITYDDLPLVESYIKKLEELGFQIHSKLRWFNAVSVVPQGSDISVLDKLSFVKTVRKVGVIKYKKTEPGKDEGGNQRINKVQQYNLDYGSSLAQNEFHEIPVVHDVGFNGNSVIIGFLDSGFRWKEHSAFSSLNVLYEYDYVNGDSVTANQEGDNPQQDSHGTSVLSLAAGFHEGELIGPAYQASVMLSKTEDISSETHIEEDNFAEAVQDMEALGADILTASLGYSVFFDDWNYTFEDLDGETTIVTQAYNKAFERGVVTVTSAGNEGNNSDFPHIGAPADAFKVITVGNVNINNQLHSSSSPGPTYDGRLKPEVVAMGVNPYHAVVSGGYSSLGTGTSYSAPVVAGMIAQLLNAYPHLTNEQVRQIVINSGDNIVEPDNFKGYGTLSAKRMLTYPNLEPLGNGSLRLNKMFVDGDLIGNPIIHIKSGNNWVDYQLSENNSIYPFDIPSEMLNDEYTEFYYTFENSSGEISRIPEDKNYLLDPIDLEIGLVSGFDNYPIELEKKFQLLQNYPNPFNMETNIDFVSISDQYAEVKIYNSLGQEIITLFKGTAPHGITRLTWDGTNNSGSEVSSGTYFYTLLINGNLFSKKMILLK